MRVRLAVELRIDRHDAPDEGPSGTESLVIHQDQPRYTGFTPEPAGNNESIEGRDG